MSGSEPRRATPEDAEAVARLTDAAYAGYIPALGRKPQPMTADYQAVIRDHEVWLVHGERERLVAVLVLMVEPDAVLIYSLAVDPAQQRAGHGRRLLAWAEARAGALQRPRVRLYTNERMGRNVDWYAAAGYREVKREPYLGSTLVHMEKLPSRE